MKVNENYILKHLLDSDILINLESNNSYVIKLNKTSKDIFEYVKKGYSKAQIIDELIKKYAIDLSTLKKDVNEIVDSMINKGIFIE